MIGVGIFWQYGGAGVKIAVVLGVVVLGRMMLEGIGIELLSRLIDSLFPKKPD